MQVRYTGLEHIFQSRSTDPVVFIEAGPTQSLHIRGIENIELAPNENTLGKTYYGNNIIDISGDNFSINTNNFSGATLVEAQNYTEASSVNLGTYIAISGDGLTVAYNYNTTTTHIIAKSVPSYLSGHSNYTSPSPSIIQSITAYGEISMSYDSKFLLIGNTVYTRIVPSSNLSLYGSPQTLVSPYTNSRISRDGSTIVVGNTAGNIVTFYTYISQTQLWTQVSTYSSPNFSSSINFGGPIRINSDGTLIIVGYTNYGNIGGGTNFRGSWYYFNQVKAIQTPPIITLPVFNFVNKVYPTEVTNTTQNGGVMTMNKDGTVVAIGPALNSGIGTHIFIYKLVSNVYTLYQTITLGLTPTTWNIALSASGLYLYITCNYNDTLIVYNDNLTTFSPLQNLLMSKTGNGLSTIELADSDSQIIVGGPSYSSNTGILYYLTNSPTGQIYLNGNTKITGNLNVTGNITGNIQNAYDMCNGRLTLTSGKAVTNTDVSGVTTVYFTPYKGQYISLYSTVTGNWTVYKFTETSIVASGTSNCTDIFAILSNGVVNITQLAWTNSTTRATALSLQNGVYVLSSDATIRYLGTVYLNGSSQTADSVANRYVWNYYNRVEKNMSNFASGTWTYVNTTIRAANGTGYPINFVIGISEDIIKADIHAQYTTLTGPTASYDFGFGVNSTTVYSLLGSIAYADSATNVNRMSSVTLKAYLAIGLNQIYWLENTNGTASPNIYGNLGAPASIQSSVQGSIFC